MSAALTPNEVPTADVAATEQVIAATRQWLEKAVIGLNLCPFAASAYVRDRVRFVVSDQQSTEGLLRDLCTELQTLQQTDPRVSETTLLIHPRVLTDFGLYNDFLDECDAAIDTLDMTGELQIASFHPDYQFADCDPTDMQNYSNRSPYPMLHLLRESSISHAVDTYADIDNIPANNWRTLHALGLDGWHKLWRAAD